MTRWILHVDLDEFLAAVEVRRRPELRGQPVVVGGTGDPTRARMVVATASYEARQYGVHSGMPLRTAARRCPHAVFLAADHPAYDAASAEVMDVLRRFPVAVEVWGWDEAALGADVDDPERLARDIQQAVHDETGLWCSIGVGDNKLRAKMATAYAKPRGVYRLTVDNWMEVVGGLATDALWGVGPKTARKLAALGFTTVGQLATADLGLLQERLGPRMGAWYLALGRGIGSTEIATEPRERRSLSHQTTFPVDLHDRGDVERELRALAAHVTADVVALGRSIERVAIIVRSASFFTRSRVKKLPATTQDPQEVAAAAVALLERFDLPRSIRLLGVRADLAPE